MWVWILFFVKYLTFCCCYSWKAQCGLENDYAKSCGEDTAFANECCSGYTCHYGRRKCVPYDPKTAICGARGVKTQECGASWSKKFYCCDGLSCADGSKVCQDPTMSPTDKPSEYPSISDMPSANSYPSKSPSLSNMPSSTPTASPTQCAIEGKPSKSCGAKWSGASSVCCEGLICDGRKCGEFLKVLKLRVHYFVNSFCFV